MSIIRLSFDETKKLIDDDKEILILDVREEEEYITGHILDAVLFTLADINEVSAQQMIPALNTKLIVYCRSGRRSSEAALKLESYGYEHIYDAGGLAGWPYELE